MSKTAIVTGGSSGIGLAAVNELASKGYRVYELSRHGRDTSAAVHLSADVADEDNVRSAVSEVFRREGHIDLLINCAGYGISGAAEFTDSSEASRQLAVNLIGTANVCSAVIPYMRRLRRGRIVNISSVAAVMPIPFQTWYSVSKSGVNTYSCALAGELRPFGIEVCAVMLGDTKTGFTAARKRSVKGDDLYGGRISRSVAVMERDEQNGVSSECVARAVVRTALSRGRLRPLYTVGIKYKAVCLLDRLVPVRFKNYVLYKIYGG